MNYIISQGVDRHRLQALVSRGESDPVVADRDGRTPQPPHRDRR
jgi:outer membrane protein OmpA-like peptidoglycan-associated protein